MNSRSSSSSSSLCGPACKTCMCCHFSSGAIVKKTNGARAILSAAAVSCFSTSTERCCAARVRIIARRWWRRSSESRASRRPSTESPSPACWIATFSQRCCAPPVHPMRSSAAQMPEIVERGAANLCAHLSRSPSQGVSGRAHAAVQAFAARRPRRPCDRQSDAHRMEEDGARGAAPLLSLRRFRRTGARSRRTGRHRIAHARAARAGSIARARSR